MTDAAVADAPGAAAPLLEGIGLGKRYGKLTVLSGLDLRVGAGEALGIIGPNGAGKSTLLGLISGAVRPSAGRLLLAGEDITRRPAQWRAQHGFACSFQIPRPFAGMTVLENLMVAASFAGHARGRAARELAIESLLRSGLSAHANTVAGDLRLLDRKRLEVARGLAADPRILLLDEIAGGLTEAEVPELVDLVRGVVASGVTVVWIEHVVHALTAVASRLMCLTYGEVIADGPPQEVLDSPQVKRVYLGIDPEEAAEVEDAAGAPGPEAEGAVLKENRGA